MRALLFAFLFGACTAHAAPSPTVVAAVPCACDVDERVAHDDDDDDDDDEDLEEAIAELEHDLEGLEDLEELGEVISERVEAIVEAALDDLDVKLDAQMNLDFDDDDDSE